MQLRWCVHVSDGRGDWAWHGGRPTACPSSLSALLWWDVRRLLLPRHRRASRILSWEHHAPFHPVAMLPTPPCVDTPSNRCLDTQPNATSHATFADADLTRDLSPTSSSSTVDSPHQWCPPFLWYVFVLLDQRLNSATLAGLRLRYSHTP